MSDSITWLNSVAMSASTVGLTAADKIEAALTAGPAATSLSGWAAFPVEYADDG